MFNSRNYWETRYRTNGNSGAGSYNNLSNFKAEIINIFINEHNITSIIDYGMGDGNQLKLINTEKLIYTGIDVSPTVINKCKDLFNGDNMKRFILDTEMQNDVAELVLSCDVLYHLIENDVYKNYMKKLFNMSKKYVIIYSRNENVDHAQHVKFRNFTDYIKSDFSNWKLIKYIPNRYYQTILGENNENASPSNFYIFENFQEHDTLCKEWETYIETQFLPLVTVELEGNIYSQHKSKTQCNNLAPKRYNIINLIKITKPKTILEIGFNSGFSSLLMKMTDNDVNITCIDINIHDYVIPCFNKMNEKYKNMKLITEPSSVALQLLINQNKTYDIIHIDGDHSLEGAKCDLELSLKLSHNNTVIIFDDTNLDYLNNLCDNFVKNGKLEEYNFPNFISCEEYKHRFFKPKCIPIYISVTSIFQNQDILLLTLKSLLIQTQLPDKIFLYLSESPCLLDEGFKKKEITNAELLHFLTQNNTKIELHWVENQCSYRKLLPLLKEKWNEDCIIITIDDDCVYNNDLIKNMVFDYKKHGCVINYRGFTPLMKNLEDFDYNKYDNELNKCIYNFPTGKGGILYKPQFFHKTNELIFNKDIFMKNAISADDIWFYLVRILNNVECFISDTNYLERDLTKPHCLYECINSKNDNNVKIFKKLLNALTSLDYFVK